MPPSAWIFAAGFSALALATFVCRLRLGVWPACRAKQPVLREFEDSAGRKKEAQ